MSIRIGPTEEQVARMRSTVLLGASRQRLRRKSIIASTGVLVALATAAAAAVVIPASTDARNWSVDCYRKADLSAAHATTMFVDDGRDSTTLDPMGARIMRAQDLCEADRLAIATDPEVRARESVVQVVHPTVCQIGDLRLAVLPNRDRLNAAEFCTQIGAFAPTR